MVPVLVGVPDYADLSGFRGPGLLYDFPFFEFNCFLTTQETVCGTELKLCETPF